ncbi:hypothetical protein QBC45DRAFT_78581 [Copromyces sp. CBS 386.78]|nr:hypothetical protein QBC45DRAFT_78581 [Copromyces sp. CBS 386.78]
MTTQAQATPRPTASPGSLLQRYQPTVFPPATSTPFLVAAASPNPDHKVAPRHLDTPLVHAAEALSRVPSSRQPSQSRPTSTVVTSTCPPTPTVTVHRLYHRRRLIGADCSAHAVIVIRVRPVRPIILYLSSSRGIRRPFPDRLRRLPDPCPGLTEQSGRPPSSLANTTHGRERIPSPCPLHRPGSSNYPSCRSPPLSSRRTTINAVFPSRRPTPKPFVLSVAATNPLTVELARAR